MNARGSRQMWGIQMQQNDGVPGTSGPKTTEVEVRL